MTETPIAQKTNALDPYPTPMFIAMEKDQERKKKDYNRFHERKKKKSFQEDIEGKKTFTHYRLFTQQRMPDRPRNHKDPKKRKKHSAAVDHRMTWKKYDVRSVEVF